MRKEDCPICQVLTNNQPGFILKRTPDISWILSLEGYPLIVPNEHYEWPLRPRLAALMGEESFSTPNLNIVKELYKANGINVLASLGKAAGQHPTVLHAHVHLIPRFDGDSLGKFPLNLRRKSLSERQLVADALTARLSTLI